MNRNSNTMVKSNKKEIRTLNTQIKTFRGSFESMLQEHLEHETTPKTLRDLHKKIQQLEDQLQMAHLYANLSDRYPEQL